MEILLLTVLFLVPMILMAYLLIVRPQKKHQKYQENLLSNLKKNDKIETYSGIIATIYSIGENSSIIVSEGSKLKVNNAAIARKIELE